MQHSVLPVWSAFITNEGGIWFVSVMYAISLSHLTRSSSKLGGSFPAEVVIALIGIEDLFSDESV
jgi:hypothetical protein